MALSLIESRARDAVSLAEKLEFEFTCSRFLSPSEQAEFFRCVTDGILRQRLFFYGGCAGADRRKAVFIPSYLDADCTVPPTDVFSPVREAAVISLLRNMGEDAGICPIHVKGSTYQKLSHRDYMGSVLGLGIDRAVVGDIAVTSEHSAVIFADVKIAPFIEESLTKVARDTVRCAASPVDTDFVIPRRFESLHLAAGSDRADSVAAALGNLSRSEAKTMCLAGNVEVNYVSPIEPDAKLVPGDIVSLRGCGKFIIDSFDGTTRSGRLKLTARRYL